MGCVDYDCIGIGFKQGFGVFKGVRCYFNGGGYQQVVLVVDGGMVYY